MEANISARIKLLQIRQGTSWDLVLSYRWKVHACYYLKCLISSSTLNVKSAWPALSALKYTSIDVAMAADHYLKNWSV